MKIEKWKYKNTEIEIPILDEDEIEKNENLDDLENTIDLSEVLYNIGEEENE